MGYVTITGLILVTCRSIAMPIVHMLYSSETKRQIGKDNGEGF